MVGEENETLFIRVWKPLPSRHVLKTLRESSKRTISASDGLGPLQMVLEPVTGRCASEEAILRRGVDMRQCASKDVGPRWGSHIDWRKVRVPGRRWVLKEGGL